MASASPWAFLKQVLPLLLAAVVGGVIGRASYVGGGFPAQLTPVCKVREAPQWFVWDVRCGAHEDKLDRKRCLRMSGGGPGAVGMGVVDADERGGGERLDATEPTPK